MKIRLWGTIVLVVGLLLAADVAAFLALPAAAAVVAYRTGRRRAGWLPRVIRGTVLPPDGRPGMVEAERDELRREVARLRADLADARESAQMAWDAAADRPPAPARLADPADFTRRLLAAPMSGVRPLLPRRGILRIPRRAALYPGGGQ